MNQQNFSLQKCPDERWTVLDACSKASALPSRFEHDGLDYAGAVLLAALLNTIDRSETGGSFGHMAGSFLS